MHIGRSLIRGPSTFNVVLVLEFAKLNSLYVAQKDLTLVQVQKDLTLVQVSSLPSYIIAYLTGVIHSTKQDRID